MGDSARASASVVDIKSVSVSVVVHNPRQRLFIRDLGMDTSIMMMSASVPPCRFCVCAIAQCMRDAVCSQMTLSLPCENSGLMPFSRMLSRFAFSVA